MLFTTQRKKASARHKAVVISGVASPKFWGGKNLGSKCLILGKQQYFVWDTISQSTK